MTFVERGINSIEKVALCLAKPTIILHCHFNLVGKRAPVCCILTPLLHQINKLSGHSIRQILPESAFVCTKMSKSSPFTW